MMPAVSQAQFAKMQVLHKQGKITDQQLANFTQGVDYDKLPERKSEKKPSKHPFGGKVKR